MFEPGNKEPLAESGKMPEWVAVLVTLCMLMISAVCIAVAIIGTGWL